MGQKIFISLALILSLSCSVRGQEQDWKMQPFSGTFNDKGISFGLDQCSHTFFELGFEQCTGRWSRCAFGNGFTGTSVTAEYNPFGKVGGLSAGIFDGGAGLLVLGIRAGMYEGFGKDVFFLPWFRPEIGIGGYRVSLSYGFNFLFGTNRFENISGVNRNVFALRYFFPVTKKETSDP